MQYSALAQFNKDSRATELSVQEARDDSCRDLQRIPDTKRRMALCWNEPPFMIHAAHPPMGVEIAAPLAVPLERRNSLLAELGKAPLPEQDYLPLRAARTVIASSSEVTLRERAAGA